MGNKNSLSISNNGMAMISDIKMAAFIRSIEPNSFKGVNRTGSKVYFLFEKSARVDELAEGYQLGKSYCLNPLTFSHYIEEGKAMIFGDYHT